MDNEKEVVILESGETRRFRMSNDGQGRPTYPSVVRCDDKGVEICRYESININGSSRMFMESVKVIKEVPKMLQPIYGDKPVELSLNRCWIETEAEVVCTLAKVKVEEEITNL